MTADEIIAQLDLRPHPEGGHYRETWVAQGEGRPTGTCIYFLLREGEQSHWHRVDATEIWHFYAGAPLILSLSASDDGPRQDLTLGPNIGPRQDLTLDPDIGAGHQPQIIVPPDHWQAARSTGGWTLVGCTVSPGFQFEGFTLASEGFDIL